MKPRFPSSSICALLTTVGLVTAVAIPLIAILISVTYSLMDTWTELKTSSSVSRTAHLLLVGSGAPRHLGARQMATLIKEHGDSAWTLAGHVLGGTGDLLLQSVVIVLTTYTFLADGPRIHRWLLARSPIRRVYVERFRLAFHETGRSLIIGMGVTALVQAAAATLLYFCLGIPRAELLGAVTFLAALIPTVGTALVWAPLAIALGISGHWIKGLILAAVGIAVISVLDNLLRPYVAKRANLQLPEILTLFAMLGGLIVFGRCGILLGPLVVRLASESLKILNERADNATVVHDVKPLHSQSDSFENMTTALKKTPVRHGFRPI